MMNGVTNDSLFLNQRRYAETIETGICKRDEFQRDRDRIMHSRAFRRMMHKTQIFNANMGDHYRNRLTHTLEVTQIARSIGKVLKLNDELIEAIALGHDLGHTPYGHVGERTLNDIMMNGAISEISSSGEGFKHNFQSLRLIDELESRSSEYNGLNLTLAVREGVLKHTKLTNKDKLVCYHEADYKNISLQKCSFTFEGQVVALADEIAQCTHDLEDGVRSKIITFDAILEDEFIKRTIDDLGIKANVNSRTPAYDTRTLIIKNLVGVFIKDACKESQQRIEAYINKYSPDYKSKDTCINEKCVVLSDVVECARSRIYHNMIEQRVICSEKISASDAKSEYIIKQLFKAFYTHPKQLPDYVLEKYCVRTGIKFDRCALEEKELRTDPRFIRSICDHISGMTDQFASREYLRLYVPDYV